jgi:hypothetical protein
MEKNKLKPYMCGVSVTYDEISAVRRLKNNPEFCEQCSTKGVLCPCIIALSKLLKNRRVSK